MPENIGKGNTAQHGAFKINYLKKIQLSFSAAFRNMTKMPQLVLSSPRRQAEHNNSTLPRLRPIIVGTGSIVTTKSRA